jgi:hypothetical protein
MVSDNIGVVHPRQVGMVGIFVHFGLQAQHFFSMCWNLNRNQFRNLFFVPFLLSHPSS